MRFLVFFPPGSGDERGRTHPTGKRTLTGMDALVCLAVFLQHESFLAVLALVTAVVLVHVYVLVQLLLAGEPFAAKWTQQFVLGCLPFVHIGLMVGKFVIHRELFPTDVALELFKVICTVLHEGLIHFADVGTVTDIASVFLLGAGFAGPPAWKNVSRIVWIMRNHVRSQAGIVEEALVANFAYITLLANVNSFVVIEVVQVVELLSAFLTLVRFLAGVGAQMAFK